MPTNKKEYMKKYYAKWCIDNSDKIKDYRKTNHEERLKYSREYNKKESSKIKRKAYLKKNTWLPILYGTRARCNNKNNHGYKYYGARGIKALLTREEIKELWFRDKAYELKQPSIDRIDSNGNYEFCNCQFIEMVENNKKK